MATNDPNGKNRPLLRGSNSDEYPWPWHHEAFLRQELIEKGRTPAELADRWECCERTIWRAIREHDLQDELPERRETA